MDARVQTREQDVHSRPDGLDSSHCPKTTPFFFSFKENIHSRHVVSTILSTTSVHESTKLWTQIPELSFSYYTSHQIFCHTFHTAKSPYPVGQKAALRRVSRQLTSISVPVRCFHLLVMGFLILSRPRWSSWITSR